MEIEDKYLKLLNLLIYDKRNGMNGIITELCIDKGIMSGYKISYKAYFTKVYSNRIIFVEDFEKGNVVFLLPFGIKYMEDEMERQAKAAISVIKEFFGDSFREDMIMRISEEERQRQIKEWDKLTIGLSNWDKVPELNKECSTWNNTR